MSTSKTDEKDVLRNLPRSRPGRSTARREDARAKRAAKPTADVKPAPATLVVAGQPDARKKAKRAAIKVAGAPVVSAPATTREPTAVPTGRKPGPGKVTIGGNATPKRPVRIPTPVSKAASSESRAKPVKPAKAAKSSVKQPAAKTPVPASGWATPAHGHGSADPAGTFVQLADTGAGILRSLLKRLPR